MTVGMSAPPMGSTSSTPNASDNAITTGNSCHVSGCHTM